MNLSEKLFEKINQQQKYNHLTENVNHLIDKIKMIEKQDLQENREKVILTLKKEIADRFQDKNLRYSVKLAKDKQFEMAINLTKNVSRFNKILKR